MRQAICAAGWGVIALVVSQPLDAHAAEGDAAAPSTEALDGPGRSPGAAADTRFALVWHNANFYAAPSRTARRARAFDFPSSERNGHLDWVWPMKVVSTEAGAGFYEIETPGSLDANAHCYDELEAAAGLRVRLFVHESDLALVTTRETRARRTRFPKGIREWKATTRLDSTGEIVLAPGVALLPHGPGSRGEFLASMEDVTVAVAIGSDANLGRSYVPAGLPARPESKDMTSLRMGSKGLILRTTVYDRHKVGAETRGTIRARCMEAELPVPPRERHEHTLIGLLELHGDPPKPASVGEVRAGAKAYWPDGAPAGTVDQNDRSFIRAAPAAGNRRCFQVAIRNGWPESEEPRDEYFLPLCFDPKDVIGGP